MSTHAGLPQASGQGTRAGFAPATHVVSRATTALFVPGDRPERFTKASESSADIVIIDLEDAVYSGDKKQALENVLGVLSAREGDPLAALVRINRPTTGWGAAEIDALIELPAIEGHGLLGLMLPKAEEASEVAALRHLLPKGCALVPLVETAIGVVNAGQIARVPGVTRLAFGAVDFALDIDASSDPRMLDHARSTVVLVSRAAGIAAPLDSPPTQIKDLHQVAADAARGRGFGFGGNLCIHPAQIGPIAEAHRATPDEIQWAQKVMIVANESSTQMDGEMIDRPVIDRARRIIARAGEEKL